MERDTLEEILAVEKEIREKLERERDAASQWLAGIRHEVEQETLAEIVRLKESVAQQEKTAQEAAQEKAKQIVQLATSAALRIERLHVDDLARRVRQHVACIVPGDPA
jgi:hypothetical protein